MEYEKPEVITTLTEEEIFGTDELMTSAWSRMWSRCWNNDGRLEELQPY